MKFNIAPWWKYGLVAVLSLAAGFFGGKYWPNHIVEIRQIRQSSFAPSKYEFINPLLGTEVTYAKDLQEFKTLKDKIEAVINNHKSAGDATDVSVYFDTRDGRWLGINTGEKYSPASLIKVPTMVAVLKAAENDPTILQKQITYDGKQDLNSGEYYKPDQQLKAGTAYTVEDLLERMIVYSDNNALGMLASNFSNDQFKEVFTDIGFNLPDAAAGTDDIMTVKNYVNVFRYLYNATYLSRGLSEKALDLLSKSRFPSGISGGLPANVPVAQKFGERNVLDTTGKSQYKELHDCGIIYMPDHPYILCAMTKGQDFDRLSQTIKDISGVVYGYMKTENK